MHFARLSRGALCALGALLLMPAAAQAQETAQPALIIAYRTQPKNWLALRKAVETDALPRFQALEKAGALKSFRVFFSRGVDAQSWNAMAVLNFNGAAGEARWYAAARKAPAGLTQADLALTTAVESTPVDLVREAAAAHAAQHPVFLIIPYKYLVSADAYQKYLDGYTVPQLKGWIGAGILEHYGIVMARYPGGRPWNAMLLLEYRSDAALARRETVKTQVRAKLAHNPKWKAISENKFHIRDELSLTVSEEVK